MSTKICKAILDLSPTDWEGIVLQGKNFLSHLYVETTLYPTPPITEMDFKQLVEDADKANVAAENGGDIEMANREDYGTKLFLAMSQKLIPYINGLWAGNRANLEKSGSKVSADPSPVPPPDQPVIKKIVRGPEAGTVKIYLVRGVNSSLKRRSRTEYRIFMFEKEDDATGVEIGDTSDSRKLIGYDVPESVYRYFGVRAKNTGGSSPLSAKVRFFLMP